MQTESQIAFQDLIPHNYCVGCGPLNEHGLHIKSHWDGEEAICRWQPEPWLMAGSRHILNGGMIATVIDCHSICTAIAHAARREGQALDSEPLIWYATASLQVEYLKPTPLNQPVEVRARVVETKGRKTVVETTLRSQGEETARGRVVAVRVPEEWRRESDEAGA